MKLNTQAALIISALIIGGSLIAVQVNKQSSIERQKQMEIAQENEKIQAEKAESLKKELDNDLKEAELEICLLDVDIEYWNFMEINGTKKEDGTIWASDKYWDDADKDKKAAQDVCFKKYK